MIRQHFFPKNIPANRHLQPYAQTQHPRIAKFHSQNNHHSHQLITIDAQFTESLKEQQPNTSRHYPLRPMQSLLLPNYQYRKNNHKKVFLVQSRKKHLFSPVKRENSYSKKGKIRKMSNIENMDFSQRKCREYGLGSKEEGYKSVRLKKRPLVQQSDIKVKGWETNIQQFIPFP